MEDLYHIDVQCPPAKQLILEGGAYNHRFTVCKLPDPHPASWTCDLLSAKVCSQADAVLIISGTWSLWNGRNYRKHGRQSWNPAAAAHHISQMVEALMCLDVHPSMVKVARGMERWKPPSEGWVR